MLKIKSDTNGCGWDEVSRRLAELGYHRSAKKCKEKFKNVYKYHKRTKESERHNNKNYRYFKELELFDILYSPPTETTPIGISKTETAMDTPMITNPLMVVHDISTPCSISKPSSEIMTSTSASTTSSSEGNGNRKKGKFVDCFERIIKEVLESQEKMQKMFIDALEKQENDRIAREEAWKAQELARLEREQEMWEQERSASAARDATIVALLQKISDQGTHFQLPEILLTPNSNTQIFNPSPSQKIVVKRENKNAKNLTQASPSRWPKPEIEALIRIRTELDMKYQDTGLKGPLWEEVSLSMKKIGYYRNAKRCKEKWENINKYFRRVRESNKRRSEDSSTCTYFNLLESIYEKKHKKFDDSGDNVKPEDILMQMQQQQQRIEFAVREDGESENVGQNQEDNGNDYQFIADNIYSMTNMQ